MKPLMQGLQVGLSAKDNRLKSACLEAPDSAIPLNSLERCSVRHATNCVRAEVDLLSTDADKITTEYQNVQ